MSNRIAYVNLYFVWFAITRDRPFIEGGFGSYRAFTFRWYGP